MFHSENIVFSKKVQFLAKSNQFSNHKIFFKFYFLFYFTNVCLTKPGSIFFLFVLVPLKSRKNEIS
jgi:hypothetical protein